MSLNVALKRAPNDVIIERREICAACPHRVTSKVLPDRCGKCGCLIGAKSLFQHSTCPDKRWTR